jgi:TRAP-type C4-dicarboxylate transport system substrate-binding protein
VKLGPTQEVGRKFFGYDVTGLAPVTLIYCSDSPYGSTGDAFALIFETMVEKESKGQIDIKGYRSGSLYTSTQWSTQLPLGTMDLCNQNQGYLQTKTVEIVPWSIAYFWKSPEHLYALTTTREWYKMQVDLLTRDWNMVPLHHSPYGNWDYWAAKPMTKLEDFRGTTFWSYGELANRYLASWGSTGVILAQAEEYMAYYRGAIDGISGSSIVYHDYKYYECGKYWLHMPTYPPGSTGFHYVAFVVNAKKWATLPDAYKRIINDASDLVWSVMIWEMLCEEKTAEWKLVHMYGVIDMAIATKTPAEYQRICDAAIAAGKNYALVTRKMDPAVYAAAEAFKNARGDPKICADYTWWYKAVWAEGDRRLSEATTRIKAGEPQDKVFDSLHPRRFYAMLDKTGGYEELKAYFLSVPRVVNDWPLEWKLAGKSQ